MKISHSSKRIIHRESELLRHFREVIDNEAELNWLIPSGQAHQDRLSFVDLRLDSQIERFKPVYRLKPSLPDLEASLRNWTELSAPLLVVPNLTDRILDFCRQKRLAAIDLNGRAYIRAEGLLVDRGALLTRNFRFELEPRNIFVGKSAGIVRALLTDRDRVWIQSALVERANVSSGLVSRIVNHLHSQNFIEKQSVRQFRLRDPLGLIDAWAKADDFDRRTTTWHYTAFGGSPLEIAHKIQTWAKEQSIALAFTQWIAGWLRYPYAEPALTSAYISRLPEIAVLERFGLRPVSDAGKIWFHTPTDHGVFLETQTVQDLPLVTDAQIYLDLQRTGLRGPDQAEALRNWQGFCRP